MYKHTAQLVAVCHHIYTRAVTKNTGIVPVICFRNVALGQALMNKVINSVCTASGVVSLLRSRSLSQVFLWEFTTAICLIKGNEMIRSEEELGKKLWCGMFIG